MESVVKALDLNKPYCGIDDERVRNGKEARRTSRDIETCCSG